MNRMMTKKNEIHWLGNYGNGIGRASVINEEEQLKQAMQSSRSSLLLDKVPKGAPGRRYPFKYKWTEDTHSMNRFYNGQDIPAQMNRMEKMEVAQSLIKMLLQSPSQDIYNSALNKIFELADKKDNDVMAVKIYGGSQIDDKSFSVEIIDTIGENVEKTKENAKRFLLLFHRSTWSVGTFLLSRLIGDLGQLTLNNTERMDPGCYKDFLSRTQRLQLVVDFDKNTIDDDSTMYFRDFEQMCRAITQFYANGQVFVQILYSKSREFGVIESCCNKMIETGFATSIGALSVNVPDVGGALARMTKFARLNQLHITFRDNLNDPDQDEPTNMDPSYIPLHELLQQCDRGQLSRLSIVDGSQLEPAHFRTLGDICKRVHGKVLTALEHFEYTRYTLEAKDLPECTLNCMRKSLETLFFRAPHLLTVVIDDCAFASKQFKQSICITPLTLITQVAVPVARRAREANFDRTQIDIDLRSSFTIKIDGDSFFVQSTDVPTRQRCDIHLTMELIHNGKKVKLTANSKWNVDHSSTPKLTVVMTADACVVDAGMLGRGYQDSMLFALPAIK